MGTNYYFNVSAQPPCECCGRHYEEESIHIGKSSVGWHFALHVYPERDINNFQDWYRFLGSTKGKIVDEYGDTIPLADMLMTILARSRPGHPNKSPQWYMENSAQEGFYGLVRAVVDGKYCIGHGTGTYDYIQGDFS